MRAAAQFLQGEPKFMRCGPHHASVFRHGNPPWGRALADRESFLPRPWTVAVARCSTQQITSAVGGPGRGAAEASRRRTGRHGRPVDRAAHETAVIPLSRDAAARDRHYRKDKKEKTGMKANRDHATFCGAPRQGTRQMGTGVTTSPPSSATGAAAGGALVELVGTVGEFGLFVCAEAGWAGQRPADPGVSRGAAPSRRRVRPPSSDGTRTAASPVCRAATGPPASAPPARTPPAVPPPPASAGPP